MAHMQVSVACALVIPSEVIMGLSDGFWRFQDVIQNSESVVAWRDVDGDMQRFITILEDAEVVVAYNGLDFDLPVLRKYMNPKTATMQYAAIAAKLHDPFSRIRAATGNWVGLGALLGANSMPIKKTASGREAVKMWEENRRTELKDYCINDVEALAHLVLSNCDRLRIPPSSSHYRSNNDFTVPMHLVALASALAAVRAVPERKSAVSNGKAKALPPPSTVQSDPWASTETMMFSIDVGDESDCNRDSGRTRSSSSSSASSSVDAEQATSQQIGNKELEHELFEACGWDCVKRRNVVPNIARVQSLLPLFAEKKLKINCRDSRGTPPLSHAAYAGHVAICSVLIRAGADVNAVDLNGTAPLQMAVCGDQIKVAELLFNSRANWVDALQDVTAVGSTRMRELFVDHTQQNN